MNHHELYDLFKKYIEDIRCMVYNNDNTSDVYME